MPTNEIEWKDCWKKPVKVQYKEITETAEIETREGKLYGYAGIDVLLKGIKGEVYPCKIDTFNDTYTITAPLSEEAIRADERAIYESQSREQIHQAERRAAKAERQRCIENFKIVLSNRKEQQEKEHSRLGTPLYF